MVEIMVTVKAQYYTMNNLRAMIWHMLPTTKNKKLASMSTSSSTMSKIMAEWCLNSAIEIKIFTLRQSCLKSAEDFSKSQLQLQITNIKTLRQRMLCEINTLTVWMFSIELSILTRTSIIRLSSNSHYK